MKKLLPYLIIMILGIGAFYQVLHYDFVWDDLLDDLITNPNLQDVNSENLAGIWQLSFWDKYIPVTFTVRALLKLAGGNEFNPFIYHLFNLLVHLLNAMLVFLLLKKFIKLEFAAFLGALIFLLHPLQVESVAWVTANEVLLSTLFGLTSLLLFMDYREKGKNFRLILSLACYGLSLLSRPALIGLPFIFIILDLLYYKSKFWQSIIRQIPYFVLLIPGAIIQMLNQPGVSEEIFSPIYLRPFIWLDNLGFYLVKLLLPYNLRPAYGHITEQIVTRWTFYLSILLTIALICIIYRIRKKYPLIVIAFIIFIVGMLPVSGLLPYVFQNWSNVADRYVYFSMLGVSLTAGILVMEFRNLRYWISAILLIFLALIIFYQLPIWKNDINLWQNNIKRSGKNVSAYNYNNLGNAFQREAKFAEALENYIEAVKLDTTYSAAYNNRGLIYYIDKNYQQAEADFRHALEIDPAYPLANYNLGRIFKERKEFDKAEQYLKRSIKQKPNFGDAYSQLGYVYARQERWQESEFCFARARRFSPYNSGLYNNLGLVSELKDNKTAALKYYSQAIRLDPGNLNAYNNRANLNYQLQNFPEAIADFDLMTSQDTLYLEAFYNRGTVLLELERYDLAIRDFSYILEKDSLFADAWLNRSIAYYHLSELEAALFDAGKYMNLGGELHQGYKEALALALRTNFSLKLKKDNEDK